MFAFAPGAKRAATRPAAKRAPQILRRAGRKELAVGTDAALVADPAYIAAPLTTWDVTGPDGVYAGAFQGSTPEDAILSYVATLGYASIDDAAMAMGFADATTYMTAFVVTETLAPAGMDPMLAPVDPLAAPAALSRRGRRGRKSVYGDVMTIFGGLVAGGAVGYLAGSAMGWIFSTIEDAYASFLEWWDQPSSAERTAQLQQSLASLRDVENTLAQQAATETDPTYLAELDSTLSVIRSVIASTEADLANPETLEDVMLPEDEQPPMMLSRRSRKSIARRLRLKASFTVADAETGEVIGTYDATTSDDAVLSYVTALGYETVEAAATGSGFASTEEFLATITVTEGEAAAPAEPETPAETLARRHRLRMKATWEVVDPVSGEIIGTYDAGTVDDAILSYAAELGFGSAEEAASAAGVTIEEWLATFTIAEVSSGEEAPPAALEGEMMDDEDEEEMPPAAMSRRGRKSLDWATFEAELNRLIPGYGPTDDVDMNLILDDIQASIDDVEMANPDYSNDPTWQGLQSLYTQLDADIMSLYASSPTGTLSRRRAA